MPNLIKYLPSFLKKEEKTPQVLEDLNAQRGILWDKINGLKEVLAEMPESVWRRTDEMQETFPLTHHFQGGLYTREVFFPKGSLAISLIHKTAHPSFILQGEVSFLDDSGVIKRLKTGDKMFTQVGAQRVIYAHKDTRWCCVYKTNKTNVVEAEDEVYTEYYQTLPKKVLKKYLTK